MARRPRGTGRTNERILESAHLRGTVNLWILKTITWRGNSIGDSLYRRFTLWAFALRNFSIKPDSAAAAVVGVGNQCRFGFREPRSLRPSKCTRNKFNRAIVKGERSNSPIDEGWWLRRLQHDAGQIDVAPAFDVELRIAVDLCLRDCTRDRTKLKWFLAETSAPPPPPSLP